MRLITRSAATAACCVIVMGAGVATAAAVKPPTDDPSHGGKAAAWRTIAPPLVAEHGPPPPHQPHCMAADITAHAKTRLIPGGVAGIIHLHGDHCEIHSKTGPDELRGGDTTLDVKSVPRDQQTDRPYVQRADLALDSGRAIWSFTWIGSWCGNHPTAVVIPLTKSHGEAMAPLTGPVPGCHANPGNQRSVLTAGPPGFPRGPDFGAPPAWKDLTAALKAPMVLHSAKLPNLRVTLTNPTDTDIPLAPCPSYSLTVFSRHGGGTAKGYGSAFPCHYQARIIPAHSHVAVKLPDSHFYRSAAAPHGGKVKITFAILGVPPAVAHARVTK
jgi:hypothetical protein